MDKTVKIITIKYIFELNLVRISFDNKYNIMTQIQANMPVLDSESTANPVVIIEIIISFNVILFDEYKNPASFSPTLLFENYQNNYLLILANSFFFQ